MTTRDDLIYQIAITMLPGIGPVYSRALVNRFERPANVFHVSRRELQTIEGIGEKRISSILNFDFSKAEREADFVREHHIRPLFFQDQDYPQRLLHCFDAPAMLYYRGTADLNAKRIVAIVGTRSPSEYGKSVCRELVRNLDEEDMLIVSGLAYGIDAVAHSSSIDRGIATVGVLAHGLDRIYPAENRAMAAKMAGSGGLITEFRHETAIDRVNFPSRNRIIAGMSDCVIVVESGIRGGSLITAELGNGYNRDVFAVPGRVGDARSRGCNYLIKTNKAELVTSAEDVMLAMQWEEKTGRKRVVAKALFPDLTSEEKPVYDLLKDGPMAIDQLYQRSDLDSSMVAQSLLMLEMKGIIRSLPGKIYELT